MTTRLPAGEPRLRALLRAFAPPRPASLRSPLPPLLAAAGALALLGPAHAGGEQELQKVTVTGTTVTQVGAADSANVGTVSQQQLDARTVYRPGELLEAAPGLIVSQHSGEGKANQFYLRGFNLDHGTDLRTTVDGMLVNQRSHGHGQGWTDLNFLIPELATGLRYKKGPVLRQRGRFFFGRCGRAQLCRRAGHRHRPPRPGPERLPPRAAGRLAQRGQRPSCCTHWRPCATTARSPGPMTFASSTACCATRRATPANGWNLTGMAYTGRWNATDQIPQRAVDSGQLGRFDLIDATDGGAGPALQPVQPMAAQHGQQRHRAERLGGALEPGAVLQLHLLPGQPGRR